MALYRELGIVLRTYKLGEADRIVVLLTKGRGKVRAVAKGVRRTKSRFGARLEPGGHITAQFYEGRELDVITQAEWVDHFPVVREDLERLGQAQVMLEAVDQVGREGEASPQLYQLLLRALRSLDGDGGRLVAPAFLFKLLALEGLRPVVDHCVVCDRTDDLVAFDTDSGGVLCRGCRRGQALSPAGLTLLQDVLGGRLAQALRSEDEAAMAEFEHLATSVIEHHLERRLRSVAVLDRA